MRGLSRRGGADSWWHVMNRGAQKLAILGSDQDKKDFLVLLRTFAQRTGLRVGSYCVMGNHYHALVQGAGDRLTHCLHEVDRLWALAYNERRGGKGHVFQGPFLSFLQVSPGWIVRTSLYIHLNPVGRQFPAPEDYPWSSCRLFAGQGPSESWVEPALVLRQLGEDRGRTLKQYRELLAARAEIVLARREKAARDEEELEIQRGRAMELALSVPVVVKELGVPDGEARRLLAHVGRRMGLSPVTLAPALGFTSANLLCVQLFRLRDRIARDPAMKKVVDRADQLVNALPGV